MNITTRTLLILALATTCRAQTSGLAGYEIQIMDTERQDLNNRVKDVALVREPFSDARKAMTQVAYPSDINQGIAAFESTLNDFNKFLTDAAGNSENANSREDDSDPERKCLDAFYSITTKFREPFEQAFAPVEDLDEDDYEPNQRRILRAAVTRAVKPMTAFAMSQSYRESFLYSRSSPRTLAVGATKFLVTNMDGTRKVNDDFLPALKKSVSQESFQGYQNAWINYLDGIIQSLNAQEENIKQELNRVTAKVQEKIEEGRKKEQAQAVTDEVLVKYGLPSLGFLMIILMVAPRIYGDKDLHAQVFSSGFLLEMFTVFLLTSTILLLGLSGRIESEVLGTLIGGISGYVLGKATTRRAQ